MANQEKNFAEKTGETVRNLGIVGGLIGLVAIIAQMRIGETLFWSGAALAGGGEVGRRLAGAGKQKHS